MQGEIMVAELMAEAQELAGWRERQARDAEWEALKQWWRAERQVAAARETPDYGRALKSRADVVRRYRPELVRAWPKWAAAQQQRHDPLPRSSRYRPHRRSLAEASGI